MLIIFFCMVQHSSTASNVASSANGLSEPADDDLPSVMTCANYLKLPSYSTKVTSLLIAQTLITSTLSQPTHSAI